MMKNKGFKKYKYLGLVVLIALLYSMCMEITSIEQPSVASVGENITIKVNVHMTPEQNTNNWLVFSVLAPKSWDVANNASASFDSPWDFGDGFPASGNMRVAGSDFGTFQQDEAKGIGGQKGGLTWSEEIESRLGFGENYGDVEWTTFISENRVKIREDDNWGGAEDTEFDGTITLNMTVGDGHTGVQLGYYIGNAQYGLKIEDPPRGDMKGQKHFDFEFTDCMTITGASGDATDLCGPAPTNLVSMAPEGFLFSDIITIQFDANEGAEGQPTALMNAGEVFACATAVLADGTTKTVCNNDSKSAMTLTGNNIWELTLWPKGYFGLGNGQVMTELHLNFQNQDGSIIVQNPIDHNDVVIVTNCN